MSAFLSITPDQLLDLLRSGVPIRWLPRWIFDHRLEGSLAGEVRDLAIGRRRLDAEEELAVEHAIDQLGNKVRQREDRILGCGRVELADSSFGHSSFGFDVATATLRSGIRVSDFGNSTRPSGSSLNVEV